MEVHRVLGRGFLEAVYQHALMLELAERGIPVRSQVDVPVAYKGVRLSCGYRVDLLCFGEVLVELKALRAVGAIERAQVIHYLRAAQLRVALLLNFGTPRLTWERFAQSAHPTRSA